MKTISAEEFDRKFDDGEDISEYIDWAKSTRLGDTQSEINLDFPQWMIEKIDREATHFGVTRQALIKVWLAERLERADSAVATRG